MEVLMIRYDGLGPRPEADMEKIRATLGVVIVNEALPKTVVVRIDSDLAKQRLKRIDGWTVQAAPLGGGPMPDPRTLAAQRPPLRVVPKTDKQD